MPYRPDPGPAGRTPTGSAVPRSSFVGRELELRTLTEALIRRGSRLVTITGAPGIGKTRLALELCAQLENPPLPSGSGRNRRTSPVDAMDCVFVPLAEIGDGAGIAAAIAAARQARLRAAADSTSSAAHLLVLDNVEHLVDAAHHIQGLLREPAELRILVTSVGPLGLDDEQVLRLGGLGNAGPHTPPGDLAAHTSSRPRASADSPCLQLFEQRARAAAAGFRLGDRDAAVVAELCDLLDGMPLAIELAAARVAAFPPAVLLAQLREGVGLDVLQAQPRSAAPPRHRSIRDALDWSYQLLDSTEQMLIAAVSVFAGSFTPAAALAVYGPLRSAASTDSDVFEALTTLVDHHFLEPVLDDTAPGRFELLPLVKRFARDRLCAAGRSAAVESARAGYIQELGRAAAAEFDHGRHAAAFALLEHQWADITATIGWLQTRARAGEALALAVDSAPYLLYIGNDAAALVQLEQLIDHMRRTDPGAPLLSRALLWSAVLTRLMADPRPDAAWVAERLADGLAHARANDDQNALLLGLEFVALSATTTGDLAGATAAVTEGIDRTTRGHDEGRLARFQALACMLAHHRGDHAVANELAAEAARRALRRGDHKATLLVAMAVLGLPDATDTEAYRLLPRFDELITLSRTIRDRHAENFLLAIEADRALLAGDDAAAAARCAEHLSLLLARGETATIGLGFSVSTLFVHASRHGQFAVAAQLAGSIHHLADAVALTSTPAKRAALATAQQASRQALGEPAWQRHHDRGAGLSSYQAACAALSYARAAGPAPHPGDHQARTPSVAPVRFQRRELEVLRALAAGKTNKTIAAELGLTPKTVMHYCSAIYQKVGVRGRAAATAWAIRNGVLDT